MDILTLGSLVLQACLFYLPRISHFPMTIGGRNGLSSPSLLPALLLPYIHDISSSTRWGFGVSFKAVMKLSKAQLAAPARKQHPC